jgi:hypothetical protein
MAWSIGDYNDFLEVITDVFGVDRYGAAELYRDMRDVLGIGPLTVGDLEEYADVASDLMQPEVLEDEGLEYDYEFDWEDEWLDEGEELEITAELRYK